ncbi:MAG: DUF1572 domain-containing protein [Gemmatimonadetes bacterium]|nr:DUF1572 domain-containing protein [Gemmatimonadota bacterium]
MRDIVGSVELEFQRYKALGEGALKQLHDEELAARAQPTANSAATLVWHMSGNLQSRFTDFLDSDGEKPWRQREEEFAERHVSREELMAKWEAGWKVLLDTLAELTDDDLMATVHIRHQPLTVHAALHRALAHAAYHTGQLVYLGKNLRGEAWSYMTIPPGKTAEYNRNPTRETGPDTP